MQNQIYKSCEVDKMYLNLFISENKKLDYAQFLPPINHMRINVSLQNKKDVF